IELDGSPSFADGELVDRPHYLLCRHASGPQGRHFPVISHGADHVFVAAALADLGGVGEGDPVSLIPAWTLATLFPPATQTTFHPSTGRLASGRKSELLFFDNDTPGTGLSSP